MKKTILSAFFVLVYVAQISPAIAIAPDVAGTVLEPIVAALQKDDVITGYSDGTVQPTGYLNRAEALKVILKANPDYDMELFWYKNHTSEIQLFADVWTGDWFNPYVEIAYKHQITQGFADRTFHPEGVVRTNEAITMLMRAFGLDEGEAGFRTSPAIDNQAGQWFTPYINAAISRNLLMPGMVLHVADPITRGQFFALVYRMRYVKMNRQTAYRDYNLSPVYAVATSVSPVPVLNAFATPEADAQVISEFASTKPFSITIPALGIKDLNVTHPADPTTQKGVLAPLKNGVGHLFSYPGGNGKIMIYGHSSGYSWDVSKFTKVFRTIHKLKTGDDIYVTYQGKLYVYQVSDSKTIDAKDDSPFKPDGSGEKLILYTCWPPDSIAKRKLVVATPVKAVTEAHQNTSNESTSNESTSN